MGTLFDPDPEPDGPAPGEPLAARVRPRTVDEVVGQEQLLAPGEPLRVALETGQLHSMLLHGPPGTGKTTLARIAARAAGAALVELSAVESGRADLRKAMSAAADRRRDGERTVLLVDELHRWNKGQQDALLPGVEDGTVTLVAATTETPWFGVVAALLSRLRVYELDPLDDAAVRRVLERAVTEGYDDPPPVAPDALDLLAARSGGDARGALTALELAITTAAGAEVDVAGVEAALQHRSALRYDRDGTQHYDLISAWIKATRASDVDASLLYLMSMLEAGEDPRYVARRMMIFASEDIGNADPTMLPLAVSASYAVEHIGMPECQYPLVQTAIALSLAPKSDGTKRALANAGQWVREHGIPPVPTPLRSGGRGEGYRSPHQDPGHVGLQPVRPPGLEQLTLWEPAEHETALAERAAEIARRKSGEVPH